MGDRLSSKARATRTSESVKQGHVVISSADVDGITTSTDITGLTEMFVINTEITSMTAQAGTVSGSVGTQVFTYTTPLASAATEASSEYEWVEVTSTTLSTIPTEYTIDTASATSITLTDSVATGDKLSLHNATDGLVEKKIGTVTEGESGIVSSADPFEDGSLIAKYEMENDVTDTTETYNGTATDITYNTGKFSQGAIFNGTTSRIDISTSVVPAVGDFSISMFINMDDMASKPPLFSNITTSQLLGQILVRVQATGEIKIFTCKADASNSVSSIGTTTQLSISTEYHIVVTRISSVYKIYVDKIDTSFSNTGDTILDGVASPAIGYYASGQFDGMIDQAEFYDRGLTQSDVDALFTQTASTYQTSIDGTNGSEDFELTVAPTSAFKYDKTDISICLEDTAERIVNLVNSHKTVEAGSQTSVSTTEAVTSDTRLVVISDNGTVYDEICGTVTGTAPYVIDITAHGLGGGEVADEAYEKGTESLTKVSSTTTEFVGTNAVSGLLKDGDIVVLDGDEVVGTTIVEGTHETGGSIVDSTNPLGDDSIFTKLQLNDNLTELTGNSAVTGTNITYTTAHYGNGAVIDNYALGSTIKLNPAVTNVSAFTLSMVFNITGTNGTGSIAQIANDANLKIAIDQSANKIDVRMAGNAQLWTNTITIDRDTVYHLLVRWDSSISSGQPQFAITPIASESINALANCGNVNTTPFTVEVIAGLDSPSTTQDNSVLDQLELAFKSVSDAEANILFTQDGTVIIPKYTITHTDIGTPATTCEIQDRAKKLSVTSKLFDGTNFDYTYSSYTRSGRHIASKLESSASGTTVVAPLLINQNKAG